VRKEKSFEVTKEYILLGFFPGKRFLASLLKISDEILRIYFEKEILVKYSSSTFH
jgi:hypothetical protein